MGRLAGAAAESALCRRGVWRAKVSRSVEKTVGGSQQRGGAPEYCHYPAHPVDKVIYLCSLRLRVGSPSTRPSPRRNDAMEFNAKAQRRGGAKLKTGLWSSHTNHSWVAAGNRWVAAKFFAALRLRAFALNFLLPAEAEFGLWDPDPQGTAQRAVPTRD